MERLYAIYINLNEFIEAILVRFVKDNNYLKDACSQPTDASFTCVILLLYLLKGTIIHKEMTHV